MKKIVKIKKMHGDAKIPTYGSECAAGADLYAYFSGSCTQIYPHETEMIGTGISMEIPEGYVGLVYARSGLATKQGLAPANKVGVIDSDYRGEIKVALHNHSDHEQEIKNGDRIAQIVIAPYVQADFEEASELSSTDRAGGGFGSTGK